MMYCYKNNNAANAVWVKKIGRWTFGRTDALDDGWYIAGIRVKFGFIFHEKTDDIPKCILLTIGKREYSIFMGKI